MPHACRPNCAACCIAISIAPCLPALPQGKPAGQLCPHLTQDLLCKLFNQPSRPATCNNFQFCPQTCGSTSQEAFKNLTELEALTLPTDITYQQIKP